MTAKEKPKVSGWRGWLRRNPLFDGVESAAGQVEPAEPGPLPERLPANQRLLGQLCAFLIEHDLEILPLTLRLAYDCVTEANAALAQRVRERAERALPVTLKWLEEAHSALGRDAVPTGVATLAEELEANLADLGRTITGVSDATGLYSTALENHVLDLQALPAGADLVAGLTALTRAMLDHTRKAQDELATSEAYVSSLRARLDDARRLASVDHLTGLPNRRAFDELFDRELRQARRDGEALCVAFCDIDHFKRINDAHGHSAGDRVIRFVAEALGAIADAKCHVARHGGEEFAVLLRGATVAQGYALLDAAREDIAERRLVNRASQTPFGPITLSGGIADALAYPNMGEALKAADLALYAAKQSGRNRIMIATDDPPPLCDAA